MEGLTLINTKIILLSLVGLLLISVAYGVIRFLYYVKQSAPLVLNSRAYQQAPAKSSMKILVLGDSTAVGTGSVDPAQSVAGRLGKDFPTATIVNRAVNGLKTDQLLADKDKLFAGGPYDLLVVHIGANDVLRLRNMNEIRGRIKEIIDIGLTKSGHVALFTSGNIGDAKLIPWFARPIMSYRSKTLRNYAVELDNQSDRFTYVDLYYKKAGISDERFYATDRLHLSGEGYGFWHKELKSALQSKTDLYTSP